MPEPEIAAVVFDLGGVLLDWNPRHLYRRLFTDPDEMEDFLAASAPPTGTARTTWAKTSPGRAAASPGSTRATGT